VWVNFWAAWCAPCKEEIPRLLKWEQKLATEGTRVHVAFISVDDDERQLSNYLASSGSDGLSSTLWLREGKEREAWLGSVGMSVDPALPVHLLVSPEGQVRCMIQGAVEDEDYSAVKAVLSGR
jgi:thiol-disulfide isomerase/thioredoxin